jgi:phospholipid transport system substrate-binding protein
MMRVLRLLLVLLLAASPAAAAQDAAGFVTELGQKTLEIINQKPPRAERDRRFRAVLHEGFDLDALSRFVLGPHWRTATDAQRAEFRKLFEDWIVSAYGARFSEYSGEQFRVLGQRPESDTITLVNSQIIRPAGGPPIRVDWRVAKHGQTFKIADVVVEGISLMVTQRQEFSSVIQRNGGQLEALLKILREKTQG